MNPTHIIARHAEVNDARQCFEKCLCGWTGFRKDHAAHVVSKLTDAGYSIMPRGDVKKLAEVRAEEARKVRWNAFCELSDLRCLDCNLRYGERKDYSCPPDYPEIGGEHSYAEDDVERLTAAAAGAEKP